MAPPAEQPSERPSAPATSTEPAEGPPLRAELIRLLLSALSIPAMAGYAVWKSKATDDQQMLLPVACLALFALTFCLWRAWLRPTSRTWRYGALAQLPAVVVLVFALLPDAPAPASKPAAQEARGAGGKPPPGPPAAEEIIAAKLGSVELGLERDVRGRYVVHTELTSASDELLVDVTSRHQGQLWSQRVATAECRRERGQVSCVLPPLRHAPEDFLQLDQPLEVRVYTPIKGCEHFAGISLNVGARLYSHAHPDELSVSIFDDDDDFTMEGRHVGTVGFYDSKMTARLLRACKRVDCGPIITLSSAHVLRELAGSQPFFRLTTDNRSRARDISKQLELELAADRASRVLYVIYHDDGAGIAGDEIRYATDQAEELQRAFAAGLLARYPDVDLHWVRFDYVGDAGSGRLLFREGAPGERARRISAKSFEELVRGIRERRDPVKRVVFIGRDMSIVEFGRALHSEYASTPEGFADVLLHVPGPREVFEGIPTGCVDQRQVARDLDDAIVLSPYGSMDTVAGWEFLQRYRAMYPGEPVAERAARIYDALSIYEQAVRHVKAQLRVEGHRVDVHVFRQRVTQAIEAGKFDGSSGTYDFTRGESGGANRFNMFRAGLGMIPVPPPEELAVPKPLGLRADGRAP